MVEVVARYDTTLTSRFLKLMHELAWAQKWRKEREGESAESAPSGEGESAGSPVVEEADAPGGDAVGEGGAREEAVAGSGAEQDAGGRVHTRTTCTSPEATEGDEVRCTSEGDGEVREAAAGSEGRIYIRFPRRSQQLPLHHQPS